jgi:dolichol-phosphate mannosyltransferase
VSLNNREIDFEFIFVDDGSGDNSFILLEKLSLHDKRVKIIKLSRNFGSFVACLAGLTYCVGDCAVIMAADLQDPPELLSDLYEKWLLGNDVVLAIRKKREESRFNIFLANGYYKLLRLFALRNMPRGGFDFFLIDRKVINILTNIREKNTTLMGLILWVGFKQDSVFYTKQKRQFGKSKWTFWKKFKYFIDSFVAFSYFPIRLISLLGITIAFIGFLFALYAVIRKIFLGVNVPGFTLVLVITLLTSGIQMIMMGVLGEYLWRSFDETRRRPIFIVEKMIGWNEKTL